MRTTVNIPDELLEKARAETGIQRQTDLIIKGLEALLEIKARQRLAGLYGRGKGAKAASRPRKL